MSPQLILEFIISGLFVTFIIVSLSCLGIWIEFRKLRCICETECNRNWERYLRKQTQERAGN